MRVIVTASAVALLLCASSVQAREKQFGDWTVREAGDGKDVYAGTVNDSGGEIGLYCSSSTAKCLWILSNKINCKDGSVYPVLVNADSGAASTQVTCMKLGDEPVYAFADFALVEGTARRSERIGIAFPLESGQFAVTRFSLRGVSKALDLVQAAMRSMINDVNHSTTDLTL